MLMVLVLRSFAVVIQQLPNPLKDAVCVFYLVLRGLDTVEDDMAIAKDIKIPALLAFHKNIYNRCHSLPNAKVKFQYLATSQGRLSTASCKMMTAGLLLHYVLIARSWQQRVQCGADNAENSR